MRFIHPAAICGLLLNAGLLFLLFNTLNTLDMTQFNEQEQEVLHMVSDLQGLLFTLVGLQALALALIEFRIPGGIILAALASFFMMPIGIIYLMGSVFSQYNARFADFPRHTRTPFKPRASFRSSQSMPLGMAGGAALLGGFFLISQGSADLSAIAFCSGFALAYMAVRTVIMPPLVFYDEHLVVVPALMAAPVALAYAKIQQATLQPDQTVIFSLDLGEVGVRDLRWRLTTVLPAEREAALKLLADVLRGHNVPLY